MILPGGLFVSGILRKYIFLTDFTWALEVISLEITKPQVRGVVKPSVNLGTQVRTTRTLTPPVLGTVPFNQQKNPSVNLFGPECIQQAIILMEVCPPF